MYLKELDLGNYVKCTCPYCNGTGLDKGSVFDLGTICTDCSGYGYNILPLNEEIKLVKDEEKNVIYIMEDGIIIDIVELFNGLKRIDNINYVVYKTGGSFSSKYLFSHGANEVNVIKYEEFLEGKIPLPITEYTCPGQLTKIYGNNIFYNDCSFGPYSECKKYGKEVCWKKFYGKAKTVKEKQDVLRRVLRKKSYEL